MIFKEFIEFQPKKRDTYTGVILELYSTYTGVILKLLVRSATDPLQMPAVYRLFAVYMRYGCRQNEIHSGIQNLRGPATSGVLQTFLSSARIAAAIVGNWN